MVFGVVATNTEPAIGAGSLLSLLISRYSCLQMSRTSSSEKGLLPSCLVSQQSGCPNTSLKNQQGSSCKVTTLAETRTGLVALGLAVAFRMSH